jgi:YHS domain-containing protein
MARVIIWAILVIVVLRALSRLLRGVLEGAGYRPVSGGGPPGVPLVRDPVCGVFVVPGQALTAQRGGATQYFCSEQCRQAWGRR